MEKISIRDNKLMPVFLISSLLFINILYSNGANANNATSPPGIQLAYFVGYHAYYGGGGVYYPAYDYPTYIYYGPRHYPQRAYWTRWRRIGYACYQKCLINGWNNRVIRCARRCYD